MATKEKKHAAWLVKDGKRGLFHGDDVETALTQGYTRVEGVRGNGQPWNPPVDPDSDVYELDVIAEASKATTEVRNEKAERKAKREAAEAKAAAAHTPEPEVKPDLRVEVVEPAKPAKKK